MQKKHYPVIFLIASILTLPLSTWLLFFKLQVLSTPKLILYFPGAYSLLIGLFISGIIFLVIFLLSILKKHKK